jgi:hypothetical protein
VIACAAAPPSDQESNSYVLPASVCGSGAIRPTVEPWMAVRLNGVTCSSLPTESLRPAGCVSKVSSTVLGSRRLVTVLLRPPSVAVSFSSR